MLGLSHYHKRNLQIASWYLDGMSHFSISEHVFFSSSTGDPFFSSGSSVHMDISPAYDVSQAIIRALLAWQCLSIRWCCSHSHAKSVAVIKKIPSAVAKLWATQFTVLLGPQVGLTTFCSCPMLLGTRRTFWWLTPVRIPGMGTQLMAQS